MKACPRCQSEMVRGQHGWLCVNNMTCGQPIIRGEKYEYVEHERGRIPIREEWREFNRMNQKDKKGDM